MSGAAGERLESGGAEKELPNLQLGVEKELPNLKFLNLSSTVYIRTVIFIF